MSEFEFCEWMPTEKWIDWNGGACPVEHFRCVDVKYRDGTSDAALRPLEVDWSYAREAEYYPVAYRPWSSLQDRYAALDQQVKTLREALEPFDAFLEKALAGFTPGWIDREQGKRIMAAQNDAVLTLDDFRRARAALTATEDSTNG